ncbi:tetratricopeptide repeat protein [Cognatazoarcus halotolerans]|uniref:hypothetical protein n=1 Tax=Cognatazoarcus halotolerans TaxID=2686016 RepID=UPI00135C3165|nr:hypothetical protein [Cognatazoarcus halotolerans]MBX3678878.1 hypothetical protein [Rhodocyclaceae bacterium]MCB1900963.1 hypothetical protein [Rhodocyclaceae bacterium]MCP5307911.1 hypothetical protein [Zoogloeaceae bacterium]
MKETAAEMLARADASIARDDHITALQVLKAAAEQHPDDALLAYRLGTEYAHIELFEPAISRMSHAIARAPALHIARFHLGLLQAMGGDYAAALASWAPLEALPSEHALHLFKRAFEVLAEDRLEPARQLLERGLAASGSTPLIDREMRRLLNSIPSA